MDTVLLIIAVAVASFFLGRKSRAPAPEAIAPTLQDPPIETRANAAPQDESTPLALRLFHLIFLVAWLAGWTVAVLTVLGLLIGGKGNLFLLLWFVAGLVGWFRGAYMLYCLVTGRPTPQGLSGRR